MTWNSHENPCHMFYRVGMKYQYLLAQHLENTGKSGKKQRTKCEELEPRNLWMYLQSIMYFLSNAYYQLNNIFSCIRNPKPFLTYVICICQQRHYHILYLWRLGKVLRRIRIGIQNQEEEEQEKNFFILKVTVTIYKYSFHLTYITYALDGLYKVDHLLHKTKKTGGDK